MAAFEIVNLSGHAVRLTLDLDTVHGTETLEYLRKLVRRDDLESVTEVKDSPARKAPATK